MSFIYVMAKIFFYCQCHYSSLHSNMIFDADNNFFIFNVQICAA